MGNLGLVSRTNYTSGTSKWSNNGEFRMSLSHTLPSTGTTFFITAFKECN